MATQTTQDSTFDSRNKASFMNKNTYSIANLNPRKKNDNIDQLLPPFNIDATFTNATTARVQNLTRENILNNVKAK